MSIYTNPEPRRNFYFLLCIIKSDSPKGFCFKYRVLAIPFALLAVQHIWKLNLKLSPATSMLCKRQNRSIWFTSTLSKVNLCKQNLNCWKTWKVQLPLLNSPTFLSRIISSSINSIWLTCKKNQGLRRHITICILLK